MAIAPRCPQKKRDKQRKRRLSPRLPKTPHRLRNFKQRSTGIRRNFFKDVNDMPITKLQLVHIRRKYDIFMTTSRVWRQEGQEKSFIQAESRRNNRRKSSGFEALIKLSDDSVDILLNSKQNEKRNKHLEIQIEHYKLGISTRTLQKHLKRRKAEFFKKRKTKNEKVEKHRQSWTCGVRNTAQISYN